MRTIAVAPGAAAAMTSNPRQAGFPQVAASPPEGTAKVRLQSVNSPTKRSMKMQPFVRPTGKALALLGAALFLAGAVSAQTVYLTFTGGSGLPLTISWSNPITFTANGYGSASGGEQPFFVFAGVGDVYSNVAHSTVVATSPTYTGIDGTATINYIYSGQNFNDVTPSDIVFTSYNTPSVNVTRIAPGATFIIPAGSLTAGIGVNPTVGNPYSGTVPANGNYSFFVTDGSYHLTNVPEPAGYAALFGLGALGLMMRRRRQPA
jgi:hypothetical protein